MGCSCLASLSCFLLFASPSFTAAPLSFFILPVVPLWQNKKIQPLPVLGSPANSLGSPLSSFLLPAHGSQLKTKKPPKAQRKRHVSFRLLRHLPVHGLGRTRRRLALRSLSVRKPLRSSAICSHWPTHAQGCFSCFTHTHN